MEKCFQYSSIFILEHICMVLHSTINPLLVAYSMSSRLGLGWVVLQIRLGLGWH